MNWQAIGTLAEIIGALAVVVSLIYVAIQIRQNTCESRTQRAQALMSANSDGNALIASTPDLAKIVQTGMGDFNALTEDEQFRFGFMFFSFFNKYDFAYHQFLDGQLDEKHWAKMHIELPLFVSLPGSKTWWDRDKLRLSKECVAYVCRPTNKRV